MLKESCLIIAGEKSGEEHAMSFLPDILKEKDVAFFGVGGDEMKSAGVDLLYHLEDFSSWGFSEVIQKIPFYFKALNRIVNEVKKRNCKTAILIDFQDFNLRLSKRLKKEGVNVLYYVAPQAWAWKEWRAQALGETVHTLFTIIPFEKKWFLDRGVRQVKSVPHPLWYHYKEKLENNDFGIKKKPFSNISQGPRLLCLPGSRNFEVKNLLPLFCKVLENFPHAKAGIVLSPNVKKELYEPYMKYFSHQWDHDRIAEALTWADMSLAASGTVTLTCALFEVPTVVCYKTSLLNEYIFHTFLNYDGPISLANIVHNHLIFPEFVQEGASVYNILNSLNQWINNQKEYERVKETLTLTRSLVHGDLNNIGEFMGDVIRMNKEKTIEH